MISEDLSRKIDFLSLLGAVMVVAAHVGWTAESEAVRLAIVLEKHLLALLVIPFFSATSGFFLAAHFGEEDWWRRETRKRIRTVLVPYVIWISVYALLMLAMTGRWVGGVCGYGFNPCKMPMLAPIWYLRNLMLLVLASPLILRALRRWGWRFLAAAYLALLAVATCQGCGLIDYEDGRLGGFLWRGFSVEAFLYFALGMQLRRSGFEFRRGPAAVVSLLVGLTIVAGYLLAAHLRVWVPVCPCALFAPFLLFGTICLMPAGRLPGWLTGCALPIYVVHGIVLAALRVGGAPDGRIGPWIAFAAAVSIPVLIYNLLCRFAPGLAGWLFGGRMRRGERGRR